MFRTRFAKAAPLKSETSKYNGKQNFKKIEYKT